MKERKKERKKERMNEKRKNNIKKLKKPKKYIKNIFLKQLKIGSY